MTQPATGPSPPAPTRVGVFGGTFDPPHHGHIVAVTWAAEQLRLDGMVVVVAGDPWQKTQVAGITDSRHRLAMTRLAMPDGWGIEVSDLEVLRPGPTYTVDTLEALAVPGQQLVLVVGSDVAASLGTWKDSARVVELAEVAVVGRGGSEVPSPPGMARVMIPQLDISSAMLRQRIALGHSVRGLLPEAVEEYAHEHRLYRGEP